MDPQHWDDEPFEVIVSNHHIRPDGQEIIRVLINDQRFSPPERLLKSKADHVYHALIVMVDTSGTAAIVCFPGVLYRGG